MTINTSIPPKWIARMQVISLAIYDLIEEIGLEDGQTITGATGVYQVGDSNRLKTFGITRSDGRVVVMLDPPTDIKDTDYTHVLRTHIFKHTPEPDLKTFRELYMGDWDAKPILSDIAMGRHPVEAEKDEWHMKPFITDDLDPKWILYDKATNNPPLNFICGRQNMKSSKLAKEFEDALKDAQLTIKPFPDEMMKREDWLRPKPYINVSNLSSSPLWPNFDFDLSGEPITPEAPILHPEIAKALTEIVELILYDSSVTESLVAKSDVVGPYHVELRLYPRSCRFTFRTIKFGHLSPLPMSNIDILYLSLARFIKEKLIPELKLGNRGLKSFRFSDSFPSGLLMSGNLNLGNDDMSLWVFGTAGGRPLKRPHVSNIKLSVEIRDDEDDSNK